MTGAISCDAFSTASLERMATVQLLSDRMKDGSRNFILLPQTVPPLRLIPRILTLWGAFPTGYMPSLTESWIDFRYRGHKFSVNNQVGDYWFFVADASCPVEILEHVANHFAELLQPSRNAL
jgi:hypothetical protein